LTTESTHETIVVGASAAGLYAGDRLAGAGRPVRVYEAQHDFAPHARTTIVTPGQLKLLDSDPGPAVLNRTRAFELTSRGMGDTESRFWMGASLAPCGACGRMHSC
jgi:2-polyprenyl-6-methoxyphenol hydroxylase-like FAD-dependent oxidoreductase